MNRPLHRLALLGAGLTLTLVGCGTATAPPPTAGEATTTPTSAYPLTVTDCGDPVTLDAVPAQVLTIGSDAIGLLDAAGAAGRITARAGEFGSALPEGLSQPPTDATILDPADPTTEKIIGSGVDAVVGYGFFKADPQALKDAGITLLTVSGECGHDTGEKVTPVTFDIMLGDVTRFGQVFGTNAAAAESAERLSGRVEAVRASRPATQRSAAAVYYFSSSSPMSAYGGTSILQTQLDLTGLQNAYGDQAKTYLEVSNESLLEADPEVIVLVYGLYGESFETARKRLLAEPGAKDLQAVKADRIIGLPGNQTTASPAAVAGLERLRKASEGLPS